MIHSAEEFVELRQSENPEKYLRAANEEATEATWLQIIHQYPEMAIWVVQNKTIPLSILERLANNISIEVRRAIAMKNKLSPSLYDALSKDVEESIRERIVYNKNTPGDILSRLAQDPVQRISDHALERLKQRHLTQDEEITRLHSSSELDVIFLRQAIDLARAAREHGAHPFGALIVDAEGQILVTARNNAVPPKGDPTQHAERLACALAGRRFHPAKLARCTLYTSTEPCAMCAGAIYWTGIGRVVYALSAKGLYSLTGSQEENPTLDLPCREVFARGQRPTLVSGPHLEEEAAQVHQGFWTS